VVNRGYNPASYLFQCEYLSSRGRIKYYIINMETRSIAVKKYPFCNSATFGALKYVLVTFILSILLNILLTIQQSRFLVMKCFVYLQR